MDTRRIVLYGYNFKNELEHLLGQLHSNFLSIICDITFTYSTILSIRNCFQFEISENNQVKGQLLESQCDRQGSQKRKIFPQSHTSEIDHSAITFNVYFPQQLVLKTLKTNKFSHEHFSSKYKEYKIFENNDNSQSRQWYLLICEN